MSYNSERSSILGRVQEVWGGSFDQVALEVFRFQAAYNEVYRGFLHALKVDPHKVIEISSIPFLPIEVFKHREVKTGHWQPEVVFFSSGTTSSSRSQHLVRSLNAYHQGARETFERFFQPLEEVVILALLPHYVEAGNSSLVSMVNHFMLSALQSTNGFYMDDFDRLKAQIAQCRADKVPFYLFGVSYALHDFAQSHPIELGEYGHIIETGGMKGRKEEMLKSDLHALLAQAFSTKQVHGEYGMTELFSQAYSRFEGWLTPATTMKTLIKEINDPMALATKARSGVIHVIDLMNIDTCAFIATADLGRNREDGAFEVLGRIDHSDLRGCQLLYIQ